MMSNPRNEDGNLLVAVVGALGGLARDLGAYALSPLWSAEGRRSRRRGREVTRIQVVERFVSITTERDLKPRRRRRRRRRRTGGG